jgi:hypothetical protein
VTELKSRFAGKVGPYRPLRKLAGFRETAEIDREPQWIRELALEDGERLIGVYENKPGKRERSVVITSRGLYLDVGTAWQLIKYEDIAGVRSPPIENAQAKFEVDEIGVTLTDGSQHQLPIMRKRGRFPDLWLFLTFLKGIDRIVRWEQRQGRS